MSEVDVDDYAVERAIPDFGRCYCFTPGAMSAFVAEVERAAAARALDLAADQWRYHWGSNGEETELWLRARAAEIREGKNP